MKRKHKKKYDFIYRIFPLFWKICNCCKQDFRLEGGWRYISGPFVGGMGRAKYICNDCAPSIELADRIIKTLPSRPKAPPCPQCKPVVPEPTQPPGVHNDTLN